MSEGGLPDTPIIRSVLRNYNPNRSGDIYVVFKPHRFVNDFDGLVVTSSHGSPYSYDTYVPVVFAGGNLKEQKYPPDRNGGSGTHDRGRFRRQTAVGLAHRAAAGSDGSSWNGPHSTGNGSSRS